MKRITLVLAITGIALIVMPSCRKEGTEKPPIEETVNANVNANESYSYTLPANSSGNFNIIQQSAHSSVSQIEKDASGNTVYNYTPANGFTGMDVVVISNEKEGHHDCDHDGRKEHHGECRHHGWFHHYGKCHHHECQKHKITFNVNVGSVKAP